MAAEGAGAVLGVLMLLLLTRVLDVLLISRDELLATNALRALELAAAVRRGGCQVHASTATAPLRWSAAGCSAEGHGRLEG